MVAIRELCLESQFGPTYVVHVPRYDNGPFVQFNFGPQPMMFTVAGEIRFASTPVYQTTGL